MPYSDSTNTKSLKAILCPFFFKNKTFLLALKLISAIQSSAICECISGVISDFSSVSQPLLQDEHPEPESPHAVQCDFLFINEGAIEVSAALPMVSFWGICILESGTIEPTGNSVSCF